MTTIDHAVATALTLLSRDSTDPKVVRDIITSLFHEDVTLEAIVSFLIATGHRREKEDLPEKPTVEDLRGLLRSMRESTPENREIWADRFNSGRAHYLCPNCGYAGNGEDFKSLDTRNVVCTTCSCLKDARYFTRSWTSDEQTAYEAEQERLRPILAAREQRERDKRKHAVDLEPKVDAILDSLDGVGDYVNEAEERSEVGPYVRTVVHRTVLPVERIVAEWEQHTTLHRLIAKSVPMPADEFAARNILEEFSMKHVLDNLKKMEADPIDIDDLEPVEAGKRFRFTRDELIHEFTVHLAKWDALLSQHDIGTDFCTDGKYVVDILPRNSSMEPNPIVRSNAA